MKQWILSRSTVLSAGYLEHDVAPDAVTKISLKCSLFFIIIIFLPRTPVSPSPQTEKFFKKFLYDEHHIRRKVTTNGEAPISTDTRI